MKGTTGIKSRRERALKMLQEQLKRGTKPEKFGGKTTSNMVSLTDKDKTRINKEIENLSPLKKGK